MTVAIRPADLESDRELLIRTISRYLTSLSDDVRFDWLYKDNPHGQARVWVAVDTGSDEIIGMAAAFPRSVCIGQLKERAWVLGDFCIDRQHRSLGLALQLQRLCLETVDLEEVAFCYDFPSVSMMAVYQRLHVRPFRQMLRLAKPLRVDRKIAQMIKPHLVARGLSAMGNLLLTVSDSRPCNSANLTLSLNDGECGEEFSELARQISGRYGLCVQRSAEYLRWRFSSNPLCRYELVTARRNGSLIGYAFFSQAGESATLAEIFGIDDPEVIRCLIDRVVVLLRQRGVSTVDAPMLESHPWLPIFQSMGFRIREAKPMVVYTARQSPSKQSVLGSMDWFLMHGDRDS
jgi:hypothetical protein